MLGLQPLFCRLALLVSIILFAGPAGAAPEVTAVRIGNQSPGTRVVFELTEPVGYRLFTLASPYRVVLDLPEIAWRAPALENGHSLVSGLRVGLFRPGTSRVVIDLSAPARVQQAFVLDPAGSLTHRLVLDLEPVAAAAFRAETVGTFQPAAASAPAVGATPAAVLPPPRRTHKPVIVIDAGHGGVDPGAIGAGGTYEKHVTLGAAKELKEQLEKAGRYKVVMTRNRDQFLRLRERVAIARRHEAELFISLHADSHPSPTTRGLSVYTLSERASDSEAAALATRENKADLIGGVDLSAESPEVVDILIDLAQRETMNLSAQYASVLVSTLTQEVRLLRDTHRFAGFAVLKAPDVPSVLVELGYLSNRTEERLLRDSAYRARLIAAIVRATDRYFASRDSLGRS